MKKTIELNGVKYQVDTEAYPERKEPCYCMNNQFIYSSGCCAAGRRILSCSDPSEAARLGVPVTQPVDDISEIGKKLLSGEAPHLIDYFPGVAKLIREGRIYTEQDLRDAFYDAVLFAEVTTVLDGDVSNEKMVRAADLHIRHLNDKLSRQVKGETKG